ncbi:hypothetical protein T190_30000 [Sinorhizobium meliloti CCBAU 01290]|nr:hypothetical protein T190_30000 [Sinorhizobium meliloti CCBAU 01290]
MSALSDAQRSDLTFAAGFMSFALGFTWFKLHAGGYRIAAAGAAALAGVLASRELMHNLRVPLSAGSDDRHRAAFSSEPCH